MKFLSPTMRFSMFGMIAIAVGFGQQVAGQLPTISHGRLGVDVVQLGDGKRIYGFLLDRNETGGIVFAVERKWFEGTWPDLAAEYAQKELAARDEFHKQRLQRLDAWSGERNADIDRSLQQFLTDEKTRLAAEPNAAPASLFLVLNLDSDAFKSVRSAGPDQRHIAGLAYQNGLQDVVVTSAIALQRQLEEKGIDPASATVDLAGHLPAAFAESDRQWAARQALVEFDQRKEYELHGRGNVLLPAGSEMDAASLLEKMAPGGGIDAAVQLGAELGIPEFQMLNESKSAFDWRSETIRMADKADVRGVLVVRLDQSPVSAGVRVFSHFLVRDDRGEWFEAFASEVRASEDEVTQDQIDLLREDPQIKKVVATFEGLGLADRGLLDKALRQGAATKFALDRSKSGFYEYLNRHTSRLDSPPVSLPAK